jgi:glyceraldehyde 3-phosphate dehydrogenase
VSRKYFEKIIVNIGREAGNSLRDIAHYVERDSTYGSLQGFLYGHAAKPVINDLDEESGEMTIDGVTVRFFRSNRNPIDIGLSEYGVQLVVDTTGKFRDPTLQPDHPGGSLRGHINSGAEKVIISAPFKLKDKGLPMPGQNHSCADDVGRYLRLVR